MKRPNDTDSNETAAQPPTDKLTIEEPSAVIEARKKIAAWEAGLSEEKRKLSEAIQYRARIESMFWPCAFCGAPAVINWEGTGKGWAVNCSGPAEDLFMDITEESGMWNGCPTNCGSYWDDGLSRKAKPVDRRIPEQILLVLRHEWNRRPAQPFTPPQP